MLPTHHREASVTDAVPMQRLHALCAAHRTVCADLSLPAMLNRIVVAACGLVGVRCGALGILAADQTYERFVQHGMGAAFAERLAGRPAPAPLTDPIAAPQVLEAGDVPFECAAATLEGDGVAFLGVPIPVREEVFGVLILAIAPDAVFGTDDEELLAIFAGGAGTAVENALLFEDARRSRDWLNASGEIARVLLAGADENTLLEIVSRALYVAEADYGSLILPTEDGKLDVAVAVGLGADEWRGHIFDPANSGLGRTIARGESRLIADLNEFTSAGFDNLHHYGPAMLAPLIDAQGIRGTVMLVRAIGRPRFTPYDLDLATTFADQVALAFQLNDARAAAESLRALGDRHRIAQELHDSVMQRLFAIGVGLEGLARGPLPAHTVERLRTHVSELDETIDEIRERVFGLRYVPPPQALRARHRLPTMSTAEPGQQTAST